MSSAFPRPENVAAAATPSSSCDAAGAVFLSQIPHGEVSDITTDGIPVKISDQLLLHSGYEPRITYTRIISSSRSGAKLREACVEFWFEGRTLGGASRKVNKVGVINVITEDRIKKSLRIEYENALVAGADNLDMTWPDLFVTWIDELSQVRDSHRVIITLPYDPPGYINTLEQKIAEYRKLQSGHTLRPFYDPSLADVKEEASEDVATAIEDYTPITDWASMENLHDDARLDFAKSAARNAFPSLQAAEIMLTNGRYLDHKWEETLLKRLCGRITACIVLLDAKTMLAFVRYEKPLPADLKNVLSDRTQIKVELPLDQDDNDEVDYSGTGMIVANRMGVDAEFVVLLKELSPALYQVATPWDRSRLVWRNAEITLLENRALAKKEIEAVRSLCDRDSHHARFQPMLLGEELAASSREDWLRDIVGCSQDYVDSCIDAVMAKMEGLGRKMNPEQESILRNVQHSYHSVDMIRGPPGCGKTTLIAAIADFLVRCSDDIVVFMCAPSNGNTHRIHEAVSHMLLSEPSIVTPGICAEYAPLRVHRQHREEEYLFQEHDSLGKHEDAKKDARRAASYAKEFGQVADDAKWYGRVAKADDKREMSDPSTGVTAAVVDLVKRNPNLIVWTDARKKEDAAAMFRDGLETLKQTPFKKWENRQQKSFKFAWRFLVKKLIANKHIICSTVGNISSSLMSNVLYSLKKGVKRKGVIIVDEASLTTDPALCNALVNVVSGERIRSEFDGQSPIIKLILIGDEAQGYPVIKTENEGYNYFGEQLARVTYERLVQLGANVQIMWEQFRMVPALCEMPNQRWYGGKLRCSQERQGARLAAYQKQLLVEYFNIDLHNKIVTNPVDRARDEDRYLRLLLANVPDGECQVEPQTLSRLNMANVEVIVRIFKELFYKGIRGGQGIAKSLSEIVVLTFYNAQRRRLLNALFDMGKALGLPEGALDDCLHTVDSYQGREAKYVILDTTVCSYRGNESLGHAGDERKACVASTRAKDLMIVVGNLNILTANFKHEERVPFVIELLKALKQRGAYKTFRTRARPEKLVGAVRDADLPVNVKDREEKTAATAEVREDQGAAATVTDLLVATDEPKEENVPTGVRPETAVGEFPDAILPVNVEELKKEADRGDLTPGSSAVSVIMTPAISTPDGSDGEKEQDWGELIKSVHAMGLQCLHRG